jgi:hypothetical protein
VAAERTLITELATALGTLSAPDLATALAERSPVLRIDDAAWDVLDRLYAAGDHGDDFAVAYGNGRAFATAEDGLAGRPARSIEWTGARRPSGDEVAPIDLRIDHVYLVSCKYLSANIANPSPARLFDGLLATSGTWDRTDWYQVVAPDEYQALYDACRASLGLDDLPAQVADLTGAEREQLRRGLAPRRYPEGARQSYQRLCSAVSVRSAQRWAERLADIDGERMLCRLLRIGSAPYFLLGADGASSLRFRVDTPWDWHHAFALKELTVAPSVAGQPRVDWVARYAERGSSHVRSVRGHVEVRWSHGRFSQPPEAKVYLDTPLDEVPGYHPLEATAPAGPARLPGL